MSQSGTHERGDMKAKVTRGSGTSVIRGIAIAGALIGGSFGLTVEAGASTIQSGACKASANWNGPYRARTQLQTGNCEWTEARIGKWQSPGWSYAYGGKIGRAHV